MKSTLADLIESSGPGSLFLDGDWVESKDQDPDGDVRLTQLADVGDGAWLNKSRRFMTAEKARDLRCTFLKPGDVLIARMPDPLGRACIFPGDRMPCVTVVDVCIARPGDGVERRWLVRQLNAPSFRQQLGRFINGTTRQRVSRTNLGQLVIDVPPLPEQRRIADILDKADAVRRKRKEAIALTEELLRSVFLQKFGDPVTNPKGWPTIAIDEVAHESGALVDGPFGSSLKPEHYAAEGVRVVRNYNINDDFFDESQFKFVTQEKFEELRRSEVLPGDVLITTKGTVGDVCLMPPLQGPSVLSASGTVRLRVPKDVELLSEFVVAQMIQPTYKKYIHSFEAGSAQQYLNLSGIRKMRLIRPALEEQRAFLERKHRIGATRQHLEEAQGQASALFDSLVSRVFRGELGRT